MATPDYCRLDTTYASMVEVHTGVNSSLNYPAEYYLDIYDGKSGNDGWHMCGNWNKRGVWYVYYDDYKDLEYLKFRSRMKYNGVIQTTWCSSSTIRNPKYVKPKPPFTPQAPDTCQVSIRNNRIYCYTRCYDADIYDDVQYYIDIKDNKPGNDGWHMFNDWSGNQTEYQYLYNYKYLKTIQLRSRLKINGKIYNLWKKSDIIKNTSYEKPKPSKFYEFSNIRTGSFKPDKKINNTTYIVYMMPWSAMRRFYEKINEVCDAMEYSNVVPSSMINSNIPSNGNAEQFRNRSSSALGYIKALCRKMGVSESGLVGSIGSRNHARRGYFIAMQEKLNECIDKVR